MKFLKFFIFALLLLLLDHAKVEAADFVVVVNKDNPVESLDRSVVKHIFLGKKTFWDDGQHIDVFLQPDSDLHTSFALEILHKSPNQLLMHWKHILFSGTGIPPRHYPDNNSMKEAIAVNPQAIGYIDAQQLDSTIKKIPLH